MKEAIGSSLLLNIALVLVGIISLILVSSIAYSKAYKAKNQIITVIEDYDGKCNLSAGNSDACFAEIESKLTDLGYSSYIGSSCKSSNPDNNGEHLEYGKESGSALTLDGHTYCIYKYTLCDRVNGICKDDSTKSYYYKVVTFMHFDFPIVGNYLEFPVSGETSQFYEKFQNIKTK